MDERQEHEHNGAWSSIPLADMADLGMDMSGLGIDVDAGDRSPQHSDIDIPPVSKETQSSPQIYTTPPSTGGLSESTPQPEISPVNTFSSSQHRSDQVPSTPYNLSMLSEDPEANLLRKHRSMSTIHSTYGDFAAHHKCESAKGIKGSRRTWSSVITIMLSVYSTAISGAFLLVALIGPNYKTITTNGKVTPSSSTLISAILAKTIELSFVTVIIALIGQELSRRASSTRRRSGVTLAELSMRGWVAQPGTMISRWEGVRYAGLSALGVVAIVAALLAMLYTSAAAALVQPQLTAGKWHWREMQGNVSSSFANVRQIAKDCYTPVPREIDPEAHDETCVNIEHAAAAYKNYYTYLGAWSNKTRKANSSDRPSGTAWLSNDTSVIAPWIYNPAAARIDDTTGIIVNNVSLAYPHTGVISAARDPSNMISQPKDLDGVGRYTINASVPSPVLHSLCATVSEDHLAPLIFKKWNITSVEVNQTTWPAKVLNYDESLRPYRNGTALDHIFEWGKDYGETAWPPVFMDLPENFNTMLNGTGKDDQRLSRKSIYILGKGNTTEKSTSSTLDYFLCQLQVSQTGYCYTSYQASGQGAILEGVCENSLVPGSMQYFHDHPDVPITRSLDVLNGDWPDVGTQMATALSLNDGTFTGQSSNARLLSQMVLKKPELDPDRPSVSEALAVLAGCTLLQSTHEAPFIHYWNYTNDTAPNGFLPEPIVQKFNASISAQQYASGGNAAYQKAFHVVLVGVFALNVMALLYFLRHRTWYVDFSEPPNLFSLAVNSPPSEAFTGCCGTGPVGKDYDVTWTLEQNQGHLFVHSGTRIASDGSLHEVPILQKRRVWRTVTDSPVMTGLRRLTTWNKNA